MESRPAVPLFINVDIIHSRHMTSLPDPLHLLLSLGSFDILICINTMRNCLQGDSPSSASAKFKAYIFKGLSFLPYRLRWWVGSGVFHC